MMKGDKYKRYFIITIVILFLIGVGSFAYSMFRKQTIAETSAFQVSAATQAPQTQLPAQVIGKPSEGNTSITQTINDTNPYTMHDRDSVINYAKSPEGRIIRRLFEDLNSPEETHIADNTFSLNDLVSVNDNVTINEDFAQLLYGYGPNDDRHKFIFDANVMKSRQPHRDLLVYLATVRGNKGVRARVVGELLPDLTNCYNQKNTMVVDGQITDALVKQQKGSLLVEVQGGNANYYKVTYDLKVVSPIQGGSLFIWNADLKISVAPVLNQDIQNLKSMYFAS